MRRGWSSAPGWRACTPVGAGHVGHTGVPAELGRRSQPGEPAAGVDHEVGAHGRAVDDRTDDAPAPLDEAANVSRYDGQPATSAAARRSARS